MERADSPIVNRGAGELYVGRPLAQAETTAPAAPLLLDSADFTTHGVIVGMTGSGKTGLGMVLLEEVLMSGVPVLAIDPKGDLGNLCLTFPDLAPDDFVPWVDPGQARLDGVSVEELAANTADQWSSGLAQWGLGSQDVAQVADAARPVIYTPGATHGVPINLMGSLAVPASTDPAVRQDELDAIASGLLGLIGVNSDPLSGREHILLVHLISRAWEQSQDLDLATLIGQIMDPPIRKLGVLELDTFFPPADRQALALRLNGLVASPAFAAWASGEGLSIERLLWDAQGRARAAVISLGHLDDDERQFAISLILSRLITWMRGQPGTSALRTLLYIDEVMGMAPPVGNPPAKAQILTLLKQARAFGVGVVLSTQNPVDLDYKAISNVGTWMIGRLQTEQDKNRLIDGLRAADGSTDLAEVTRVISGLGRREFMLRTTKSSDLTVFSTRWAMSYLAGPLTRDQIATLSAERPGGAATGSTEPAIPTSTASMGASAGTANAGAGADAVHAASIAGATTAASMPASGGDRPTSTLADDETLIAPTLPKDMHSFVVHPSAEWLDQIPYNPDAPSYTAAIRARLHLLFTDTKADLRHQEEWEAILPLTDPIIDVRHAIEVDFDDRDFSSTLPPGMIFKIPPVPLTAATFTQVQRQLRDHVFASETVTLRHNRHVKLWSRPGESAEDFARRCRDASADEADREAAKIRERLEARRDRIEAAMAKAEDRVSELQQQASSTRTKSIVDIGTSVLGSLLGGRSRTSGLATSARRAASAQKSTSSVNARLSTARNRVAEHIDDLEQLEADLASAMIEIDDEWREKALDGQEVEIAIKKQGITVEGLHLVWLPLS